MAVEVNETNGQLFILKQQKQDLLEAVKDNLDGRETSITNPFSQAGIAENIIEIARVTLGLPKNQIDLNNEVHQQALERAFVIEYFAKKDRNVVGSFLRKIRFEITNLSEQQLNAIARDNQSYCERIVQQHWEHSAPNPLTEGASLARDIPQGIVSCVDKVLKVVDVLDVGTAVLDWAKHQKEKAYLESPLNDAISIQFSLQDTVEKQTSETKGDLPCLYSNIANTSSDIETEALWHVIDLHNSKVMSGEQSFNSLEQGGFVNNVMAIASRCLNIKPEMLDRNTQTHQTAIKRAVILESMTRPECYPCGEILKSFNYQQLNEEQRNEIAGTCIQFRDHILKNHYQQHAPNPLIPVISLIVGAVNPAASITFGSALFGKSVVDWAHYKNLQGYIEHPLVANIEQKITLDLAKLQQQDEQKSLPTDSEIPSDMRRYVETMKRQVPLNVLLDKDGNINVNQLTQNQEELASKLREGTEKGQRAFEKAEAASQSKLPVTLSFSQAGTIPSFKQSVPASEVFASSDSANTPSGNTPESNSTLGGNQPHPDIRIAPNETQFSVDTPAENNRNIKWTGNTPSNVITTAQPDMPQLKSAAALMRPPKTTSFDAMLPNAPYRDLTKKFKIVADASDSDFRFALQYTTEARLAATGWGIALVALMEVGFHYYRKLKKDDYNHLKKHIKHTNNDFKKAFDSIANSIDQVAQCDMKNEEEVRKTINDIKCCQEFLIKAQDDLNRGKKELGEKDGPLKRVDKKDKKAPKAHYKDIKHAYQNFKKLFAAFQNKLAGNNMGFLTNLNELPSEFRNDPRIHVMQIESHVANKDFDKAYALQEHFNSDQTSEVQETNTFSNNLCAYIQNAEIADLLQSGDESFTNQVIAKIQDEHCVLQAHIKAFYLAEAYAKQKNKIEVFSQYKIAIENAPENEKAFGEICKKGLIRAFLNLPQKSFHSNSKQSKDQTNTGDTTKKSSALSEVDKKFVADVVEQHKDIQDDEWKYLCSRHQFNVMLAEDYPDKATLKELASNPTWSEFETEYHEGLIANKFREYKQAIEKFKNALKLNPGNESVQLNIAATYRKARYPDKAIRFLNEQNDLSPLSPECKKCLYEIKVDLKINSTRFGIDFIIYIMQDQVQINQDKMPDPVKHIFNTFALLHKLNSDLIPSLTSYAMYHSDELAQSICVERLRKNLRWLCKDESDESTDKDQGLRLNDLLGLVGGGITLAETLAGKNEFVDTAKFAQNVVNYSKKIFDVLQQNENAFDSFASLTGSIIPVIESLIDQQFLDRFYSETSKNKQKSIQLLPTTECECLIRDLVKLPPSLIHAALTSTGQLFASKVVFKLARIPYKLLAGHYRREALIGTHHTALTLALDEQYERAQQVVDKTYEPAGQTPMVDMINFLRDPENHSAPDLSQIDPHNRIRYLLALSEHFDLNDKQLVVNRQMNLFANESRRAAALSPEVIAMAPDNIRAHDIARERLAQSQHHNSARECAKNSVAQSSRLGLNAPSTTIGMIRNDLESAKKHLLYRLKQFFGGKKPDKSELQTALERNQALYNQRVQHLRESNQDAINLSEGSTKHGYAKDLITSADAKSARGMNQYQLFLDIQLANAIGFVFGNQLPMGSYYKNRDITNLIEAIDHMLTVISDSDDPELVHIAKIILSKMKIEKHHDKVMISLLEKKVFVSLTDYQYDNLLDLHSEVDLGSLSSLPGDRNDSAIVRLNLNAIESWGNERFQGIPDTIFNQFACCDGKQFLFKYVNRDLASQNITTTFMCAVFAIEYLFKQACTNGNPSLLNYTSAIIDSCLHKGVTPPMSKWIFNGLTLQGFSQGQSHYLYNLYNKKAWTAVDRFQFAVNIVTCQELKPSQRLTHIYALWHQQVRTVTLMPDESNKKLYHTFTTFQSESHVRNKARVYLAGGANINYKPDGGDTYACMAVKRRSLRLLEILYQYGANWELTGLDGLAPLQLAVITCIDNRNVTSLELKVIETLIGFGASIDQRIAVAIWRHPTWCVYYNNKTPRELIQTNPTIFNSLKVDTIHIKMGYSLPEANILSNVIKFVQLRAESRLKQIVSAPPLYNTNFMYRLLLEGYFLPHSYECKILPNELSQNLSNIVNSVNDGDIKVLLASKQNDYWCALEIVSQEGGLCFTLFITNESQLSPLVSILGNLTRIIKLKIHVDENNSGAYLMEMLRKHFYEPNRNIYSQNISQIWRHHKGVGRSFDKEYCFSDPPKPAYATDSIHDAARDGDCERIRKILKINPKAVWRCAGGGCGWRPIHHAANFHRPDALLLLMPYHHSDEMTSYISNRTEISSPRTLLYLAIEGINKNDWHDTDYRQRVKKTLYCLLMNGAQLFSSFCPEYPYELAAMRNLPGLVHYLDIVNEEIQQIQQRLLDILDKNTFSRDDESFFRGLKEKINQFPNFPLRKKGALGCQAVHKAAWSGNCDILGFLIERDKKLLNQKAGSNWLPIHHAAQNMQLEASKLILNNAINTIDAKGEGGNTALHIVLQNLVNMREDEDKSHTCFKMAIELLSNGASLTIQNYKKQTPLHLLFSMPESIEVIEYARTIIIKHEVNFKLQDRNGKTLLDLIEDNISHTTENQQHQAIWRSVKQFIEQYIKSGKLLLEKSNDPKFTFDQLSQYVVVYNDSSVFNVFTRDPHYQCTAIHRAAWIGNSEVVKGLLLADSRGLYLQAGGGYLPLHHACKNNQLAIVITILAFVINDHDKLTKLLCYRTSEREGEKLALFYACQCHDLDVAAYLLKMFSKVWLTVKGDIQSIWDKAVNEPNWPLATLLLEHCSACLGDTGILLDKLIPGLKLIPRQQFNASKSALKKLFYIILHLQAKSYFNPHEIETFSNNLDYNSLMFYKVCEQEFNDLGCQILIAARRNLDDQIKHLLQQGASQYHARDDYQCAAIHIAAWEGHLEIVKTLVSHDNDVVMLQAGGGWLPIHHAAANHQFEVLDYLLQNFRMIVNHRVNKGNNTDPGCTALLLAITRFDSSQHDENRLISTIACLVKYGADKSLCDMFGNDAVKLVEQKGLMSKLQGIIIPQASTQNTLTLTPNNSDVLSNGINDNSSAIGESPHSQSASNDATTLSKVGQFAHTGNEKSKNGNEKAGSNTKTEEAGSDDVIKLLIKLYYRTTLADYIFNQHLQNIVADCNDENMIETAARIYYEIYQYPLTDEEKRCLYNYLNQCRAALSQVQKIGGTQQTKADGNCFFHSVYGRSTDGLYVDNQAQQRRQQFAQWLGEGDRRTFGHLTADIFDQQWPANEEVPGVHLALLVISELSTLDNDLTEVVLRNYGKRHGLGGGFITFYQEINEEWQAIAEEANQAQVQKGALKISLISTIQEYRSSLTEAEINEDLDGIVEEILQTESDPTALRTAFNDYQNQPDEGDIKKDRVLSSETIFKAYCNLISDQDYYINNIEARVIAHKDNICINFYTNQGRDRMVFNPEGNTEFEGQQVNAILHNGINHYECYHPQASQEVRDIETLFLEQAKLESLKQENNNGLTKSDSVEQEQLAKGLALSLQSTISNQNEAHCNVSFEFNAI